MITITALMYNHQCTISKPFRLLEMILSFFDDFSDAVSSRIRGVIFFSSAHIPRLIDFLRSLLIARHLCLFEKLHRTNMDSDKRIVQITLQPQAVRRLRSASLHRRKQKFLEAALTEEACHSTTLYKDLLPSLATGTSFPLSLDLEYRIKAQHNPSSNGSARCLPRLITSNLLLRAAITMQTVQSNQRRPLARLELHLHHSIQSRVPIYNSQRQLQRRHVIPRFL